MEGRKFVCKYCSKRFPCGKSLGGHIRTHMTEERSNADGDNMFTKFDGVRKKRDLWCGTTRKFDSLGHNLVGVSSKKIANGFDNKVYENDRKDGKYKCSEGEMDNGSYDSMDGSDENSSESDSFPTPRSHNSKALNGKKKFNKAKKKLKSKKTKDHECPICYRIFKSGQALGGHKRSHFIGGSEENTLVIKQAAPVVPCLIDLNLPAPVDE
uniref:C2H2-type domain-containing protein n=1 Tax=Cajanus cajan TaxID=3821 RepID=A0A151UAX1_CAJCA|nr:hypothetical protein KK1_020661 [Cajanus cajan]